MQTIIFVRLGFGPSLSPNLVCIEHGASHD